MRGWLLLDGEIRQRMYDNNAAIYLEGVHASDWTNVDWDIDEVETEDSFAFVRIRLTGGQFPAFLDASRAGFTIGPGDGATRSLIVKFGPFGQRSIFAYGG
jgi:hypothetical protein